MDLTKLYDKGRQAFERRNYDYAIQVFTNIIELEPNSPEAFKFLRASALKREEVMGKSSRTMMMFGTAKTKGYYMAKKWDTVFIDCVKALPSGPRDTGIYRMFADAAMNLRYPDIAIQGYRAITELDPNNFDANFFLAQLYMGLEDFENAHQCCMRAKALNPKNHELTEIEKRVSALRHMQSTNLQQAATAAKGDFSSNLKNKDQAEHLNQEVRLMRTEDEIDSGIQYAMKEWEANPSDKKAVRKVADLYAKKESWKEAVEWYNKVIELDPTDAGARDRIGDIQIIRLERNVKLATEAYQQAPSEEGKAAVIDWKRKLAGFELKEKMRRVADHPTDLRKKFDLGESYFRYKKIDEAIGMFQQSVKEPKTKLMSLFYLGKCFSAKELFDVAYQQFEAAMKDVTFMNDLKKDILYYYGDTRERAGDRDGAKKLFAEIYQHDINYRDVSKRIDNLKKT